MSSIPVTDVNSPEINRLKMVFQDSETENRFWRWNFPERLGLLNRNLVIAAISNFLFIFADIHQWGFFRSLHLILMRSSLSLMLVAGLWLINRKKNSETSDTIIRIISSLYVTGISIVFYFTRNSHALDGSVLLLIILAYYFFIPQSFYFTIFISVSNSLIFIFITWYYYRIPEIQLNIIAFSLLTLNFYCIVYTRSVHLHKRKEYFDFNNLVQYKTALESEILDKQILEEELRNQAETDYLTGIMNRRAFFDIADKELNRSIRYHQPLSAILFDLDYFKKINDRFGHATGDIVLKNVAEKVKSRLRKVDIFARLGGEEFIMLLPGTGRDEAVIVAEKIRRLFEEDKSVVPEGFTASFGVIQAAEDMRDITEFISAVDRVMYKAKESGRNRVESA